MRGNKPPIALIIVVIICMVSGVAAHGHYRGGHWGGHYGYSEWRLGFPGPYYWRYHTVYPYNYVVVETPEVRTTTIVTSAHDSTAQQKSSTALEPKPEAKTAALSAATLTDTLTTQQQPSIGDTTTIYVPNSAGRFTAVKLVRRAAGYTGPQGEFYPHNPTVDQLRALYSY